MNVGTGKIIFDLRKKIQGIQADLDQLGPSPSNIPEMNDSANLLRSNEYLLKANDKKTELLSAYEKYSESLEVLLSLVFDIQMDLKEILKEQSSMISNPPKTKPKNKSKIKPGKK